MHSLTKFQQCRFIAGSSNCQQRIGRLYDATLPPFFFLCSALFSKCTSFQLFPQWLNTCNSITRTLSTAVELNWDWRTRGMPSDKIVASICPSGVRFFDANNEHFSARKTAHVVATSDRYSDWSLGRLFRVGSCAYVKKKTRAQTSHRLGYWTGC